MVIFITLLPTDNISNRRFRCRRAHKTFSLGGPRVILITLPPLHREYLKPTIPPQKGSHANFPGRSQGNPCHCAPPHREYLKPTIPMQKGSQKHLRGRPKLIFITLPRPPGISQTGDSVAEGLTKTPPWEDPQ